jgi:hypothetical protein
MVPSFIHSETHPNSLCVLIGMGNIVGGFCGRYGFGFGFAFGLGFGSEPLGSPCGVAQEQDKNRRDDYNDSRGKYVL